MLENNASKTSTFSNSEIRPLSQSEIELISGGKKSQGSFWGHLYHDIVDGIFGGGSDSGNSGIKNGGDGLIGPGHDVIIINHPTYIYNPPAPAPAPSHFIPVSSSVNGDSDGDNYY